MTVEGPRPGLVLTQRYKLERELGRGGMGAVWLAEHLSLKSKVAVKVLFSQAGIPHAETRFLAEARAAAKLSSPHVVKIFDHGLENGIAFLVMEHLTGETLASRLQRESKLTPELTATVVGQIARGIGCAHAASIVHRDLKPDNVFLVENGDSLLVKVLDFGIAKALSQNNTAPLATDTGVAMGTIPYMSPEQIEDSKRVGVAADIWSLGVIAFECLLGRPPFVAENIGALVLEICHKPPPVPSSIGQVPLGFDDWFAQVSQKQPRDRFESVEAAAAQLSALCGQPLHGNSEQASPPPLTATPVQTDVPVAGEIDVPGLPARSAGFLWVAAGAAALSASGALLWGLTRPTETPEPALSEQAATPPDALPKKTRAHEPQVQPVTTAEPAATEGSPIDPSVTSPPLPKRDSKRPAGEKSSSRSRPAGPLGAKVPAPVRADKPPKTPAPSAPTPKAVPAPAEEPPLFL